MHPYMVHRKFLSSSLPYARAFRKRAAAGGAIRKWFRAAFRRWQRNKMIASLEALDDATLRDIGIHRGEIRNKVNGFGSRTEKGSGREDRRLSESFVAARSAR